MSKVSYEQLKRARRVIRPGARLYFRMEGVDASCSAWRVYTPRRGALEDITPVVRSVLGLRAWAEDTRALVTFRDPERFHRTACRDLHEALRGKRGRLLRPERI